MTRFMHANEEILPRITTPGETSWHMVILYLCITPCLYLIREKHHGGTHARLWTRGRAVCRWPHVRQGSSMWHYLMFCSINDSAIQLGSVAGITPLSPPPSLRPTHVWAWGPLLKSQMSDVIHPPLIEKDPARHRGARRPCFWAGDGKTPLLGLVFLLWSVVVVMIAPWRPYYWPFIYFVSNWGWLCCKLSFSVRL